MNLMLRQSDVEILDTPTVQITMARHPFMSKAHVATVRGGLTVAELVAEHWSEAHRCAVTADGGRVEREDWEKVIPRETVEMVGVPQGPIAAFVSAIAATISSAFTAFTSMFAAGGIFAAGSFGAKLLGLGLSLAARFLLNALFPPSKPQLSRNEPSPTYSIGGARNEQRPFGVVPVILGTHRVSPLYAAQPYTENRGDDQYLRAIFCWGHGPLSISDIRIGETKLTEFEGVTNQTRNGYTDDTAITLYPSQVFQEDLNIELVKDEENVRTTAPDTDEIIVDITAPNGVYLIQRKTGENRLWGVSVRIQYRPTGTTTWLDWAEAVIEGKDEKAIRRSHRIEVDRGQYDVRLERFSPDYDGPSRVIDDTFWTAIRSIRNESPINSDVPLALTGLRIKATAQLSGNLDTVNAIVTSRVKSWNGSSWVDDTPSNNPADLFRHVLQCPANRRPVSDDLIDLDKLAEWHEFCDDNGFTFNHVRDFSGSVWETLRDIAAAGRAVTTFVDGKWSIVWDDPDAPVVQHFTPANSSGFTGQRAFSEEVHGWRVRFINQYQGFLQDERIVYDDGYDEDNATKFEGLEFPGVTEPSLIWKHGRYHIAQLRLRRETYELTTDFEHLVCTRGDRVRVTHDVPKWGLAFGRVVKVSGNTVILSGDVTMEAGNAYVIRFRKSDGTSVLRDVVLDTSGTTSTVELVAGGTSPEAGNLYMFGVLNSESTVLRVQSIRPGPDFSARLTLVDDAPAIYNADQGTIPPFNPNITEPVDLYNQPPRGVIANEVSLLAGGEFWSGINLSWLAPALGLPSHYLAQWKDDDLDEWQPVAIAGDRQYTIPNLVAGSYQYRVKAVYPSATSAWVTGTVDLVGPFRVPEDVDTFRAAVAGASILLTWSGITDALVRDYEIRFSPLTTGATWQSSTVLVSGIEGTSYAAPYAKGTYLIKARSWREVYSENATGIIATTEPLETLNAVETATDDSTWGGTYDDTAFDANLEGLVLDGALLGYYTLADSVDLGEVYTSRLTASLAVGGTSTSSQFFTNEDFFTGGQFFRTLPDKWAATAQVRYTNDDPSVSPSWSEWEDLRVSDYTGRAFQFRIRFESFEEGVTPLLTSAVFVVDMPDRIIADQDVQSTTSGKVLTFDPAFKTLKALNVTGQDLQQGDYHVITSKSESGATVTFYDSNGSKVDRSFDYQAIGYGSVTE